MISIKSPLDGKLRYLSSIAIDHGFSRFGEGVRLVQIVDREEMR